MITCHKIKKTLNDFADGALDSEQTWAVKMHIASCESCMGELARIQAFSRLLKGLHNPKLSASFDTDLRTRVEKMQHSRSSLWNRMIAPIRAWTIRGSAYSGAYRRLPAYAVAGLAVVCAVTMVAKTPYSVKPVTPVAVQDNSMVAACLAQHHSFVSTEPLADPSAQALEARTVSVQSSANVSTSDPLASENL